MIGTVLPKNVKENLSISISVLVAILALFFSVYGKFDNSLEKELNKKVDCSKYEAEKQAQNKTLERLDKTITKNTKARIEDAIIKEKLLGFLKRAESDYKDQETRLRKIESRIK